MAYKWNRKTRRQMSHYGIKQEVLNEEYHKYASMVGENAFRQCAAGIMLAIVDHFGFPPEKLHDLAVETMKNINGSLCASELVDRLKNQTGFDVDEPLQEFEVYVPEEETNEDYA